MTKLALKDITQPEGRDAKGKGWGRSTELTRSLQARHFLQTSTCSPTRSSPNPARLGFHGGFITYTHYIHNGLDHWPLATECISSPSSLLGNWVDGLNVNPLIIWFVPCQPAPPSWGDLGAFLESPHQHKPRYGCKGFVLNIQVWVCRQHTGMERTPQSNVNVTRATVMLWWGRNPLSSTKSLPPGDPISTHWSVHRDGGVSGENQPSGYGFLGSQLFPVPPVTVASLLL